MTKLTPVLALGLLLQMSLGQIVFAQATPIDPANPVPFSQVANPQGTEVQATTSTLPATAPTSSSEPVTVTKFVFAQKIPYTLEQIESQIKVVNAILTTLRVAEAKPLLWGGVAISGVLAVAGLAQFSLAEVEIIGVKTFSMVDQAVIDSALAQQSKMPGIISVPLDWLHSGVQTGLKIFGLNGKLLRMNSAILVVGAGGFSGGWYYFSGKFIPEHIAFFEQQKQMFEALADNKRVELTMPK